MTELEELLPDAGEYLATGWEPGAPADDSIVRNYLMTLSDRLMRAARITGARVVTRDDAVLVDLASAYVFDNIAICLGPWNQETHDEIARAASAFFGPERSFVVLALSHTADLRPHGLTLVGHPPLMYRAAGGEGPPVPPDLEVCKVESAADVDAFGRTLVSAYPLPGGGAIVDPRLVEHGALSAWVGYADGVPVATAGSHTAHGLTEVEWVSTMPEHRGHGYGAALTWLATIADPRLPAVLLATDAGQPVYRRLGYVPVLRLTVWLRPGGSVHS